MEKALLTWYAVEEIAQLLQVALTQQLATTMRTPLKTTDHVSSHHVLAAQMRRHATTTPQPRSMTVLAHTQRPTKIVMATVWWPWIATASAVEPQLWMNVEYVEVVAFQQVTATATAT